MAYQEEMKGIKLLQERSKSIKSAHVEIGSEIEALKHMLETIEGAPDIQQEDEYEKLKLQKIAEMNTIKPLTHNSLKDIYSEAEDHYSDSVGLSDILSIEDFAEAENSVSKHVHDFNKKYCLDGWDYAIGGACGLFAAMLDLLCVKAPTKPIPIPWQNQVDGIFNQLVQKAFNKVLPPNFSKTLSDFFPIGAPDSSTLADLIGAPPRALNPLNHRLRSLAHDPVLGVIFGVWDMIHGTCTTVVDGNILIIPGTKASTDGNVFQLIGRMLGHLLSDVNAPSSPNMNRGMGLPAPFMGLLRMLEGVRVGGTDGETSNFGKQIEWMYMKGYDFRQFIVSSIPMAIMEILLRVFYVGKQMKLYNASFGETMLDTVPAFLNPRFRMILAIAYGTSSSINAGKMYITHNILNANWASWMGLAWNGFHALTWAMVGKHLARWGYVEQQELDELERTIQRIDSLQDRAIRLPT